MAHIDNYACLKLLIYRRIFCYDVPLLLFKSQWISMLSKTIRVVVKRVGEKQGDVLFSCGFKCMFAKVCVIFIKNISFEYRIGRLGDFLHEKSNIQFHRCARVGKHRAIKQCVVRETRQDIARC